MARRSNIYNIFINSEFVYHGVSRAEFVKTLCSFKNREVRVRIDSY